MTLAPFLLQLNSSTTTLHPGVSTALGVSYGTGALVSSGNSSGGQMWGRVTKNDTLKGRAGVRYGLLNPKIFLDTSLPPLPYILRFQDVALAVHTSGTARGYLGFGGYIDDVDIAASLDLIGFYAVSGGNWFALIKDHAATYLNQDTGISSAAAHELTVQLNGSTRTASFLIDGTQVATYQFVAPINLGEFASLPFEQPPIGYGVFREAGGVAAGSSVYFGGGASRPTLTISATPQSVGAPAQPTLSIVSTSQNGVSLAGSVYSHPNSTPHKMSVWQIDEVGGDFSTPVAEKITTLTLTSAVFSGLTQITTYIARVAYLDQNFVASPWSDAVAFSTTGSPFTCQDASATSYSCND